MTKEELIQELKSLKKRLTDLEVYESEYKNLQKLFESLYISSPIGLYIVQDGCFVVVSAEFERISGYSNNELRGSYSLNLVLPEDRDMVRENAVMILKGKYSRGYELRIITKTGEIKTILETIAPIQYQGKRAVLGNFMDITERKKLEQTLRKSEEKYSNLVENAPVGITVATTSGDIIDINRALLVMSGFDSKEEFKKMPISEHYYDPKDRNYWIALLQEKDKVEGFEVQLKRKDGTLFWALFNAITWTSTSSEDQQLISVIQDITERKKLEEERERLIQELQKSLAKVNTLSGLLPICAWCKKLRDDEGYWKSVEEYISEYTGAEFTHGICPDCRSKLFAEDSHKGNSKQNNKGKGS